MSSASVVKMERSDGGRSNAASMKKRSSPTSNTSNKDTVKRRSNGGGSGRSSPETVIVKKKTSKSRSEGADQVGEPSRWPSFAEDDYIVFCFGDNGVFNVTKDYKSTMSSSSLTRTTVATTEMVISAKAAPRAAAAAVTTTHQLGETDVRRSSSSRNVNRKLDYSEIAETRNGFDKMNSFKQKKGYGSRRVLGECNVVSTKKVDKEEEESLCHEKKDSCSSNVRRASMQRSDSNQSDKGSRGSFSFPELRLEWRGSPVQMPKPEELQLQCSRKARRVRCVSFQCCRF